MRRTALVLLLLAAAGVLAEGGCSKSPSRPPAEVPPVPACARPAWTRADDHTPESVVADWGPPERVGASVNSPCPQDAIEISRDGQTLYFMFTPDLIENLPAEQVLSRPSGTYFVRRTGGPGDFGPPTFFNLGKGISASLDGEPSFSPDGHSVYFHSLRATNTGYQADPPTDDYLDIYVAELTANGPGPGVNLGAPVNSASVDGEAAIHPDGVTLYFASTRGGNPDLWHSRRQGQAWSAPVQLPWPINTPADEIQPAFTADGNTMYFMSTRNPLIGAAIYRTRWDADSQSWGAPELAIKGIVGEPSLTGDGRYLYFVHVLGDAQGNYDADVWYCERVP
jgi:Tol biopolymer transport system component